MTEPPGTPPEEWHACAVCARVLEILNDTKTGEKHWMHPYDVRLAGEDHPAVPVLMSEIETELRCDFCFWIHPQWEVPARNFKYNWLPEGFPTPMQSTNNWAACDACADLIRQDKWFKLLKRAKTAFMGRFPMENPDPDYNREMSQYFAAMYRQLQENITGPPRRIRD